MRSGVEDAVSISTVYPAWFYGLQSKLTRTEIWNLKWVQISDDLDIIFVVSKAEYQWPKQIFEGAIQFCAIL